MSQNSDTNIYEGIAKILERFAHLYEIVEDFVTAKVHLRTALSIKVQFPLF